MALTVTLDALWLHQWKTDGSWWRSVIFIELHLLIAYFSILVLDRMGMVIWVYRGLSNFKIRNRNWIYFRILNLRYLSRLSNSRSYRSWPAFGKKEMSWYTWYIQGWKGRLYSFSHRLKEYRPNVVGIWKTQ